jgi:hypothetical protein
VVGTARVTSTTRPPCLIYCFNIGDVAVFWCCCIDLPVVAAVKGSGLEPAQLKLLQLDHAFEGDPRWDCVTFDLASMYGLPPFVALNLPSFP